MKNIYEVFGGFFNSSFDTVEGGAFRKIAVIAFLLLGIYWVSRELIWKLKKEDRRKYFRPFWQEEEFGMIHTKVDTDFGVVGSDGYDGGGDSIDEDFLSADERKDMIYGNNEDEELNLGKGNNNNEKDDSNSAKDIIDTVADEVREKIENIKPY